MLTVVQHKVLKVVCSLGIATVWHTNNWKLEGATQGSCVMVAYGLLVLPPTPRQLKGEMYADSSGSGGKFIGQQNFFERLCLIGPLYDYDYPE
jgi:hypothetical protein